MCCSTCKARPSRNDTRCAWNILAFNNLNSQPRAIRRGASHVVKPSLWIQKVSWRVFFSTEDMVEAKDGWRKRSSRMVPATITTSTFVFIEKKKKNYERINLVCIYITFTLWPQSGLSLSVQDHTRTKKLLLKKSRLFFSYSTNSESETLFSFWGILKGKLFSLATQRCRV